MAEQLKRASRLARCLPSIVASLGLAIPGRGGLAAFFSHPALIALAIAFCMLSGVADLLARSFCATCRNGRRDSNNRKFTELYNVQRLKSSFVAKDSQVCISIIQRMYALLKDEPLDETAEEATPADLMVRPKQSLPVVYNEKIPPKFFDFIIIP